jgi:hypothetical protein
MVGFKTPLNTPAEWPNRLKADADFITVPRHARSPPPLKPFVNSAHANREGAGVDYRH